MRTLATATLALLVTGCAITSGIVPVGPNTYAVSEMRAPVRGGGQEARRVVLAEANGFCQRQGRAFVPVDLRPDGDPWTPYWPTAFDATFQCLPIGDPAVSHFHAAVGEH